MEQKRCYKNFGSSVFVNVTEKCETENATVISILTEAENKVLKDTGTSKSKWLGIDPSKEHPKAINPDSILWMDNSLSNYSKFNSMRECKVDNCCVYQLFDGSWDFTECDYQYDVWCYITFEKSHERLVKKMDEHMKNATNMMETYREELLKSDNIKRLSTILREIQSALQLAGKQNMSANMVVSTLALALSVVSIITAIVVLSKIRKHKTTKNPEYNGIARAPSFNYLQRERCATKSEMTEVNFNYGKSENDVQNSSLERSCTRHIDSPIEYGLFTGYATSEAQEV